MPIRAKKSLGQHFLADRNLCSKIVRLAGVEAGDHVIEIGPGTGVLTRELLQAGALVTAVEVDSELASRLGAKVDAAGPEEPFSRLRVVKADILSLEWGTLLEIPTKDASQAPVRVVGNLPYNISSQTLLKMIDLQGRFQRAAFMVQKEMADRVCASAGGKEYGALTLAMQYHFSVGRGFDVKPGAFRPPPKVMSSVFWMEPLGVERPSGEWEAFERVVRAGFRHRRKTLFNNLKREYPGGEVRRVLRECGVGGKARAEAVGLEGFRCLAQGLGG